MAFIAAAVFLTTLGAAEPVPTPFVKPIQTEDGNYERPFEPPTRSAFIPLPPGAVEPEGWLRDWCLAAKDGYTGHLDDVDLAFQHAWAVDYKMTGDQLTFWGGLGSQSSIPFGKPQEIKVEVERLCTEMGNGGGYILAPAKPIQPETPIENIAALLESFFEQSGVTILL